MWDEEVMEVFLEVGDLLEYVRSLSAPSGQEEGRGGGRGRSKGTRWG